MADIESLLLEEAPRIGVFLCECGGKISDGLDVGLLKSQVEAMPGVVFVAQEAFPCSKDGQARVQQAICAQKLDRVMIAGCAPRLMEKLFVHAVEPAGMQPGHLMVVNIRELAVMAHPNDPLTSLQEARKTIAMGVARLAHTWPPVPHYGRVIRSALVIGSGLSGMTVALALAEKGILVTILEQGKLAEEKPYEDVRAQQILKERIQTVRQHPLINIMPDTHVTAVNGHPGDYLVWLHHQGETKTLSVGAVIVANISHPKDLGSDHWFDRSRVKTQTDFEVELAQFAQNGVPRGLNDFVMILCAEETQISHCSRVCCNTGIQQAIRVKQLHPDASVTVLFRDLYLGGTGNQAEAQFAQARQAGVTFFRYRKEAPPVIGDQKIDVQDTLTGEPLQIPFDRAVLSMPLVPVENTKTLAALLGLPQDTYGFLAEPRIRLRPGRFVPPGIYVLGSAQLPADTTEALFQAYLTSIRVVHFLNQESTRIDSPVAEITAELCTGCGNCPQVCPTNAIEMQQRDGILSLSNVDAMRCIGCGNCVVVCPVKAISLPGWDHFEIPAQIDAALNEAEIHPGKPKILVLACEWSAYGAAEAAGHRKIPSIPAASILRMNCSARFDPFHILWAFLNGADGVLLGACAPGECHYGMGNLYARERVEVLQNELVQHGIDPRRLRLEYFSVQDGMKFASILDEFAAQFEKDPTMARRIPVKAG